MPRYKRPPTLSMSGSYVRIWLALWAKQYGLHQAQYIAGHKYVNCTERYGYQLRRLTKRNGKGLAIGRINIIPLNKTKVRNKR